ARETHLDPGERRGEQAESRGAVPPGSAELDQDDRPRERGDRDRAIDAERKHPSPRPQEEGRGDGGGGGEGGAARRDESAREAIERREREEGEASRERRAGGQRAAEEAVAGRAEPRGEGPVRKLHVAVETLSLCDAPG